MDQQKYVRKHLGEASKARGGLMKVSRAVGIDHRTVRSVLDPEHGTHVSTFDKLEAYFRKAAKSAPKEVA